jgi:hypothetical protein
MAPTTSTWNPPPVVLILVYRDRLLVKSVPEDQFTRETRFRRRLRLDTYRHYPQHAAAIRTWRK